MPIAPKLRENRGSCERSPSSRHGGPFICRACAGRYRPVMGQGSAAAPLAQLPVCTVASTVPKSVNISSARADAGNLDDAAVGGPDALPRRRRVWRCARSQGLTYVSFGLGLTRTSRGRRRRPDERCHPRRDSSRPAPRSVRAGSCPGWQGDECCRSGCKAIRFHARCARRCRA
jgi:hypothetical protein